MVAIFLTVFFMCNHHPTFEVVKLILCFFQWMLLREAKTKMSSD